MKRYFLNLFKNHQTNKRKKNKDFFLGLSCLDLENIRNHEAFILNNPIENELYQKKSFDLFSITKEKLSYKIYEKLNKIHKTNFSYNYWDFIIGFYIELLIGIVYQRFILLNKIKKNKNFFTTELYQTNLENIAPNSTNDFINNFLKNNKSIIHYIDSTIIKKNKICHYFENQKSLKDKHLNKNKNTSLKLKFLFKFSSIFFKFNPFPNNVFLSVINPRFIILSFLKKFKIPIFLDEPNLNYKYKYHYRNWSVDIRSKNKFEKILSEMLPKILPRSVLEGYSTNYNFIKENYKYPINNIFFTNGISDLFKILIAEKKITGAKIINVQHGGNYGTIKRYLDEIYELKHSDYFLSYGFGKKSLNYKVTSKIIRLGPLNFEKKIKPTIEKKKYLFILPHFIFGYLQMNTYPWTKQKLDHLNQIINLFNSLDKRIKKVSVIRFHHLDKGKIQNYMKKSINDFKYFKVCNNSKLDFENYNLIISLYSGTSMLQSLYKNIPTIISFPTNYFKLKQSVKKNFIILKKNNIFFEDTTKLADFLNNPKFNSNNWWYNKTTQLQISKFTNSFCMNKNQEKKMNEFLSKIN